MYFALKKPDLQAIKKRGIPDEVFDDAQMKANIFAFIKRTFEPEYLFWDTVQYKQPAPQDVSREDLWFLTKIIRESQRIASPMRDEQGRQFGWIKLPAFEEFFHAVDMNMGGELFVRKADVDAGNKQKLIMRGIMEEAIASSQLEGAATSRQVAKQMLREGRKPRNTSERMIVNNYRSMKAIEDTYKDQPMSIAVLMELHALITDGVVDSEGNAPRKRTIEDSDTVVADKATGIIYHKAPSVDFVDQELQRLVAFANNKLETDYFIHPVIKAIMLHFWIGYLHPFTDGNGRLARSLFYWYLLREGYWAFIYLPISTIIKRSPKQYVMAYVYSEQDDNDLTYFIDYSVRKIKLSLRDFNDYLAKESRGNIKMKKSAEVKYALNDRQVYLLQYLYGDPDERTTLTMHMNIYQVAKMTAAKDLRGLVNKGFLRQVKQGKYVYYYGTDKIKQLF